MSARSATWDALAAAIAYPTDQDVAVQQAYVEAFDLDPDCSLDVGWHLVGDGPDRGLFLAFVREALTKASIAENGELPDHLSHVLRLIGREAEEDAADLARLIAPAVGRIADALARRQNRYSAVMTAIHRLLNSVSASALEEVHP